LRNTKKEEITTILLPCKPVLDVYTQPASVYPKDFDGGYLPVERSVKKTLLDKLNEMEVMGMDADSRKLFKQINLDDFNWIISQTIDFDSEFKKELDKGQDLTWKGYEHPESLALESMLWSTKGIEEIWVIGKGRIRKIVLHK
jgi:hypothetical protein